MGGSIPDGSLVKNPPVPAGDEGVISSAERSPGGGNGNSLQYSCLENSMDRGAWQAMVCGIAKSPTWLRTHAKVGESANMSWLYEG